MHKVETTSLLQEGLLNNPDSPFAAQIVHERGAIERGYADRQRKAAKIIGKGRGATLSPIQKYSRMWHGDLCDKLSETQRSRPKDGDERLVVIVLRAVGASRVAQVVLTNVMSNVARYPNGVPVQQVAKMIGADLRGILNGRVLGTALRRMAREHQCPCKKCNPYSANAKKGVCERLKRLRGVNRLLGERETTRILRIAKQKKSLLPEELDWVEQRTFTRIGIMLLEYVPWTCYIEGKTIKGEKKPRKAFTIDNQVVIGGNGTRQPRTLIPSDTFMRDLRRSVDRWCYQRPHYPPSLIPPPAWADPEAGGYTVIRNGLIANGTRAQYAELAGKDLSKVYSGLDAMGAFAWQCAPKVRDVLLAIAKGKMPGLTRGRYDKAERWVSGIDGIPPTDNPPQIEHPLITSGRFTKPSDIRKWYKTEEGAEWKKTDEGRAWGYRAVRHFDMLDELQGLRSVFSLQMNELERHASEDEYYFGHRIDFRGRAQPMMLYHSHHGPDFIRGVLRKAHPEVPNDESRYWIKIAAANHYGQGYEQKPMSERVKWTDEHADLIRDVATDPLKCIEWLKADEPFQFLSACIALHDEEHAKRFVVWQDASANGLQHFSAAGRDPVGAALVNLVDGPTRSSAYRVVAAEGLKNIPACLDESTEHLLSRLVQDMDASVIKQPVLSTPYSVTESGMRDQMILKLKKKGWRDDDAYDGVRVLAKMVMMTMREVAPGCIRTMEWIRECTRIICTPSTAHPLGRTLRWTSPHGLPVRQPYFNQSTECEEVNGHTYSLVRSDETLPVDTKTQINGSSPNIVHSWDAANASDTAVRCRREGIEVATIFDCFGCSPGDVSRVRKHFLESFVETHERDLLSELIAEWRRLYPDVDLPDPPAKGTFDLRHVLRSTYALS